MKRRFLTALLVGTVSIPSTALAENTDIFGVAILLIYLGYSAIALPIAWLVLKLLNPTTYKLLRIAIKALVLSMLFAPVFVGEDSSVPFPPIVSALWFEATPVNLAISIACFALVVILLRFQFGRTGLYTSSRA